MGGENVGALDMTMPTWQRCDSLEHLWASAGPWIRTSRVTLQAAFAVGLLLGGCRVAPKPIFEMPLPPIEWPPHPMPPRIRYVGEIGSSADLKPQRSPFQAFGDLLVGSRLPEKLYGPRAVLSLPDEGAVWVADPGGRCLHLFDLKGRRYRRIVKMGVTPLLSPVGVCRGAEGTIYVCDAENAAIYHLRSDSGALIAELRIPDALLRPVAIHYDEAADELFVVDSSAHDVKVIGPGGALRRIIGGRGSAPGEFNYPVAIADDGELIWVVDTGNHRVQGLTRRGNPVRVFGQAGDAPGDMALPKGIAVDSDGHLYIVDGRFENVQVFERSGRLLLFFGQEGHGPGEFWLPAGIAIDDHDRIWICDSYNARIQVFDYLRKVPTVSQSDVQ